MPESKKQYASGRSVFKMYWQHTARYPWLLAAAVGAMVLIQAGELTTPWLLRQFFNLLRGVPDVATVHTLAWLIVGIGLVSFFVWGMRRAHGFALMHMELRVMRDLGVSAFESLIRHSYNFFISRFAGSLTHRVNKFSRAYEVIADGIILQFIPTLLFVCGAVCVLFIRNHLLGIILGVWAVLFMSFQLIVARMRQPLRALRSEQETRVTGVLADSISNHTTALLFSGLRHEGVLVRSVIGDWYKAALRAWSADEWIWAGVGFFMTGIEVGLLWVAMLLWQRGQVTIGDFVLIQAYLLTTFERLVAINRELRRFYDSFADASEMVGMLEIPYEIADAPSAKKLSVTEGSVDLKDVTFYFNPERPVFTDFNLHIRGGERVALVGPSGAGKSTITRLLLRMYDVCGGSITIDGQDISGVTQESLRDAIAFVPQEPILFHRSLMENIRYGRRDAGEREVLAAARLAHCDEFISRLPHGYGTYVGERGVKLSGGERQRVAIARAILKNAPILILDEATSSLDSESEALIQDALATLMRAKTVLVIAHRLSTIMKMDRIVVLEEGAIVDSGRHEDLLSRGGLYQKLWSIQAGGFLPDEDPALEEKGEER